MVRRPIFSGTGSRSDGSSLVNRDSRSDLLARKAGRLHARRDHVADIGRAPSSSPSCEKAGMKFIVGQKRHAAVEILRHGLELEIGAGALAGADRVQRLLERRCGRDARSHI